MAIKIECIKCDTELKEQGALLFSPPDNMGWVKKYHYCQKCWELIKALIENPE